MRELYGRVTIPLTTRLPPKLRYLHARRNRFARRLVLAGVRPASIKRYLSRAFSGLSPFTAAMKSEMERTILEMIGRRKLAKRRRHDA